MHPKPSSRALPAHARHTHRLPRQNSEVTRPPGPGKDTTSASNMPQTRATVPTLDPKPPGRLRQEEPGRSWGSEASPESIPLFILHMLLVPEHPLCQTQLSPETRQGMQDALGGLRSSWERLGANQAQLSHRLPVALEATIGCSWASVSSSVK